MATVQIKTGGLGGQGVILAGMIIGRGATIYDTKHATLTQSFGPEARGSACGASIVISDEPIEYPYVTSPDILMVMSQEAFNRFAPQMAPDGILLYEADFVEPKNLREPASRFTGVRAYGIPATRIAEELHRRMVANIAMVGFFAALAEHRPAGLPGTGSPTSKLALPVVGVEALRKSVKASVPPGTEALNLESFQRGLTFGQDLKAGKTPIELRA